MGEVKVCIVGQDPYPERRFATGLAFSIPRNISPSQYPPTLKTIFGEYKRDLGYPQPQHGDLTEWANQGVLLWNTVPSCRWEYSLSHDWKEWEPLTREILLRLSGRGIVFVFLGAIAKRNVDVVDQSKNEVILLSHPSPRGSMASKNPFIGGRMFSTINAKLNQLGLETIDWRLSDEDNPVRGKGNPEGSRFGHNPIRSGGRILSNTNNADLGPLPDARGFRIRQ